MGGQATAMSSIMWCSALGMLPGWLCGAVLLACRRLHVCSCHLQGSVSELALTRCIGCPWCVSLQAGLSRHSCVSVGHCLPRNMGAGAAAACHAVPGGQTTAMNMAAGDKPSL